jgi:hypothetical protein
VVVSLLLPLLEPVGQVAVVMATSMVWLPMTELLTQAVEAEVVAVVVAMVTAVMVAQALLFLN